MSIIAAILDGLAEELTNKMRGVQLISHGTNLVALIAIPNSGRTNKNSDPREPKFDSIFTIRIRNEQIRVENNTNFDHNCVAYDYENPESIDKIIERALEIYSAYKGKNNA